MYTNNLGIKSKLKDSVVNSDKDKNKQQKRSKKNTIYTKVHQSYVGVLCTYSMLAIG